MAISWSVTDLVIVAQIVDRRQDAAEKRKNSFCRRVALFFLKISDYSLVVQRSTTMGFAYAF